MQANDLHLELSQQILELCRRESWSRGQRLTERGLAARLGVSRSPVRAALQYLASRNIVSADPGVGYSLCCTGRQLENHLRSVPMPTAEGLYLKMLKDRFAGRLGDQVSEADMMRRYGVSRGALQKVLMRLAREGFAHRGQGHGWVFHEVLNTIEAYQSSYELRLAIEPAAIRSPNFKPDAQRLERMLDIHRRLADGRKIRGMTGVKVFELDAELHETIALYSGNRFFLETIRYHNQLRRIVEYESFAADERMQESSEEHVQILEALVAGDSEWAAAAMIRHLKLASNAIAVFPGDKSA